MITAGPVTDATENVKHTKKKFMSEFKGTKGKWILRENKSTIMSEEKCLIARVFDGKGNALLTDKSQSDIIVEANALLISKAPEMLEMLKRCERTLREVYEVETTEIKQLIKQATEL